MEALLGRHSAEDEVLDVDGALSDGRDRDATLFAMAMEVRQYGAAFWDCEVPVAEVQSLLHEAYRLADLSFNAQAAAEWGEQELPGGIPAEVVAEHTALLRRHGGDFTAMAAERLAHMSTARLSHDRVRLLTPTNPEIPFLHVLVDGMPVDLPDGFFPNSSPTAERPPLRKLYITAHKAVDALLFKLVDLGWAFVLPLEIASAIPGIHFSPAHWAVKPAKQSGRAIVDSTDCTSKFPVLNSPAVALAAERRFGKIVHPTIVSIVQMICEFQASSGVPWSEVVLWKMDLRNAYHLLAFDATSCRLFAVELLGGLVLIFLCGMFGWSATPACFQVVTRALVYEMNLLLPGPAQMYVDDIVGACKQTDRSTTLTRVAELCVSLLGSDAVAHDKTEFTSGELRSIDVIGYSLNVELRVVTLTRRNFLRTLYAFFSVRDDLPLPVPTIERLASLASRYSLICRELRPFTRALYRCTVGIRNRRVSVPLTPQARLAVGLWRALLCVTALDPLRFARPFATFVSTPARFIVEFDASLHGLGFVISKRVTGAADTTVCLGAGSVSLAAMEFGQDASYQNTAEFMAVVISLIVLVAVVRPSRSESTSVELRGDSVTALRWAEQSSFKSSLVGNAAVLFVLVMVRCDVQIASTVHVPGEDNVVCDTLSRPDSNGRMRSVRAVLPGVRDFFADRLEVVREALQLCDPRANNLAPAAFTPFWAAAGRLVSRL